jgi:hypothetical protein
MYHILIGDLEKDDARIQVVSTDNIWKAIDSFKTFVRLEGTRRVEIVTSVPIGPLDDGRMGMCLRGSWETLDVPILEEHLNGGPRK